MSMFFQTRRSLPDFMGAEEQDVFDSTAANLLGIMAPIPEALEVIRRGCEELLVEEELVSDGQV